MTDHTPVPRWAVLSDLDGTLLDTEDAWHRAVMTVIREHTGDDSPRLAALVEGATLADAALLITRSLGLPQSASEIEHELEVRSFEEFDRGVRWRPGAEALVAGLSAAGVPLAIVTSSPRHWVERFMTVVDLSAFDVIITADDVRHHKPDAEPYLLAAASIGVPVDDCIVLEDSFTGMTSALHAGCRVLLVRPPGDELRPEHIASVDSLLGIDPAALLALLHHTGSPAHTPTRRKS